MSDDIPAPDRVEGAPHPRETERLFGQDAAERQFLGAYGSGRLHHAWLLQGPRGIGKATLAWRIARFLLSEEPGGGLFGPPETLDVSPDHPVARRIAAGSEPGLATVTRSVSDTTNRLRNEIVVDDVRRLGRFFGLTAPDGGRRVVIVDAADEMNTSAANALLKMLEEPPARSTLLLIAHQPSRLLPTIRSRCRILRLSPLGEDDMRAALTQAGAETEANPSHLAALAGGSVGAALRLASLDGLSLYSDLVAVIGSLPRLDRTRALALSDKVAQRGAADRFELLMTLIDIALARLARTGATGTTQAPEAASGEAEILARLSPSPDAGRAWAEAAAEITPRLRRAAAVNLDPASLVLDTVIRLQRTAAG